MGAAKIGGKWQRCPSPPLLPQRNVGPLDKHLQVPGKMTCFHHVKEAPTWATEKPAPHFGKLSGLALGSREKFKIR